MFWLIYSVLSALMFGGQDLVSYYLTNKENISSSSLNTVYHVFIVVLAVIFLVIGALIKPTQVGNIVKNLKTIGGNYLGYAILAGLAGMTGNILLFQSYKRGKNINPGIMTGLSNGAVIISTFLAFWFYQKKINKRQILGIIILLVSFAMLGNDNFKGFDDLFGRVKQYFTRDKATTNQSKSPPETFSSQKTGKSWLILALGSAVAYGLLSFFQYVILQKDKKIDTVSMTITVALVQAIVGIILYYIFKQDKFKAYQVDSFAGYNKNIQKLNQMKYIPYTLGGAFLDGLGLMTLLLGYIGAPNPGFSDAISDAYLIPLGIASYFIFGTKMNQLQLLGIVTTVLGGSLIST